MSQLSLPFGDNFLDFTDEATAQKLLADTYPLLWISLMEPWNRLQVRRGTDGEFMDLNEGEIAQWLHGQIKRRAAGLCKEYPHFGCQPKRVQQQFYLVCGGQAIVVFKKLRHNAFKSRLERSNYLTKRNMDLWQQRRLQGCPDAPRLIVGYRLLKELTEIKLAIGYPRTRGRTFQWLYPIPDQSLVVQGMFESKRVEQPNEEERRKGFIVKPRRMDSEEHGTA